MSLIQAMFRSNRGTLQSPNTPLSEAYDILAAGETSKTGIQVTDLKALGLPGFWKGINLISRAIGKTPITVKRLQGQSKIIDKAHPAWYLVRKMPSGRLGDLPTTAFIFKQTIQSWVLMYGNGYAYIVRDTDASPIALILLDPKSVIPVKENGRLVYIVGITAGEYRRVNPMNMLHMKGLSYDGLVGYSILDIMRDSLGLNLAYQINQSVFFRNGMRPGWVMEVPWRFKDEDAVKTFRRKLGKIHQGVERTFIPMILENGAKAVPLNITQEDAQFLQSREFDLRMLANILMLPSSKLNDIAKVAYNSLEQENQSVLDEAYEPWFVLWEEELEYKLLSEAEKLNDTHEIAFERRKLVQTPFRDRIEGLNKGVLAGWLGRDEVRQWEDLNPIPEGMGEKFFVPANVTTQEALDKRLTQPVNPQPPQLQRLPNEDEDKGEEEIEDERIKKSRDIIVSQLRETVDRLFKRRIMAASRRKSIDAHNFMQWVLDEMVQHNRKAYIDLIEPKVTLLHLLGNGSTDTRTSNVVDEYLLKLQRELNDLAGMVEPSNLMIEVDKFMVKHESRVSVFVDTLIEKA